ncbi:MAG: hypothetical protein IT460_13575 [Planctomycetes bacterium]|nr:hypothetical protein [Planctomycetota bacterium]
MRIRRIVGWTVVLLALPWFVGGLVGFALGILRRAPIPWLNESPTWGIVVTVASTLVLAVGDAIRGR